MPDNCFFGDHHHRDLQSEFLAVEQPRQQQQQHWSSSRPSSPLASALDFSLLLFEGFEGGSSSFRMLTSSPVPAPLDAAAQVADVTTTTTTTVISSPDVSPIKSCGKSNCSAAEGEGEDSDGVGGGGSPARLQPKSSPKVFFSAQNKISVFSLEYRVDYHLKRIMKSSRLINFKNAIEGLPIEERIYESLLEIILSSHSLISRRQSMITIGEGILEEVTALLRAGAVEGAFAFLFGADASGAIASLKHVSSSLGQLVWALNSNKEHVKYVAKVFALPETYHREKKSLGGGGAGAGVGAGLGGSRGCGVYAAGKDEDFGVVVQLKERLAAMVALAEQTIARAETLRAAVHDALLATALAMAAIEEGVFGGGASTGTGAEDEKQQELLGDQEEEEEAPTEAIVSTTTDEAYYPFSAVAVAAEA